MRALISSLVLSLALSACGLASFDVPVKGRTIVKADSGSPTETVEQDLGLPASLNDVRISQSKEFKDSGISESDIKSVVLKSLSANVISGDDLDFIQKVDFWVTADGLEKVKVAEGEIPAGSRKVSLKAIGVNLKNYALSDSMSVSSTATRHAPENDTEIEIKAVFHVEL